MSGLLTEIKGTLDLQRAVDTLEKKNELLAPRVSALGNSNKALTEYEYSLLVYSR